ncbi:hypothetical protein QJS66_13110 [Kocuria rhizophila]|nr:hypothetical protein QJS66_13110 [Kocuria rhizophila]
MILARPRSVLLALRERRRRPPRHQGHRRGPAPRLGRCALTVRKRGTSMFMFPAENRRRARAPGDRDREPGAGIWAPRRTSCRWASGTATPRRTRPRAAQPRVHEHGSADTVLRCRPRRSRSCGWNRWDGGGRQVRGPRPCWPAVRAAGGAGDGS